MVNIFEINFSQYFTTFANDIQHSTIKNTIEDTSFFDIDAFNFFDIKCPDISFEDTRLFDKSSFFRGKYGIIHLVINIVIERIEK